MKPHVLLVGMAIPVTPPRANLPDWHEVLAACCGHIGDEPDAHPVTKLARALAELHLARRRYPGRGSLDMTRQLVITCIDTWVQCCAPFPDCCNESPGAAIDRLAAAQVEAIELLHTCESASDELVHEAWWRLAELANKWSDYVGAVVHGQSLTPQDRARAREGQ